MVASAVLRQFAGPDWGSLREFEASDRIIDAKVFGDGSMKIRNAIQSRQRIKLEGDPPQRDGFEPDFRGARARLVLQLSADEPGVLRGRSQVRSEATSTRRLRKVVQVVLGPLEAGGRQRVLQSRRPGSSRTGR